jgi:Uncharacterized protein conserved in bacteria
MYNIPIKFDWDPYKSGLNRQKYGIDFSSARMLWEDPERIEIEAPFPLENRFILIGKINNNLWTAIHAIRNETIRIISVRRSRKEEKKLYEKEEIGPNQ